MAEGEEHPGAPLSSLLPQPHSLLTHFWPASPREAQHLLPPHHAVGFFSFFFFVKRAPSYQKPSSHGPQYSSPAFIYWNCTALKKHKFPADEPSHCCSQRALGLRSPSSIHSPLPGTGDWTRLPGLRR